MSVANGSGAPVKKQRVDEDVENKASNVKEVEIDDGIQAADLHQRLKMFYGRLFPFQLMFDWLSYGDPKNVFHREMSYTLVVNGDEIYARYKSYPDAAKFKAAIALECPIKLDIGAIYPCAPADRSSHPNFFPLERELVFDIDLTDYDDTRFCCQGAAICEKCFGLMRTAIAVTDQRLRDDFGFKHILWVFSGRRGVHCWVADKVARTLTLSGRCSVIDCLTFVQGGEQTSKKVNLGRKLHPMVRSALATCTPFFEQYLEEQELFQHADRYKKLLDMIPSVELRSALASKWESAPFTTNKQRWDELKAAVRGEQSKSRSHFAQSHPIEEIIFAYTYPRFDTMVTRGMNHLLKSPFCIHPKTQNLCSLIDPHNLDAFSLKDVPTLPQLLRDLDNEDESESEGRPEYYRTHLKPSIKLFEKFLRGLKLEREQEKLAEQEKGRGMEW